MKNFFTGLFVLACSAAVAVGRFTVPGRPIKEFSWPITYEALAHIWVGVLLMGACGKNHRWLYLSLLGALVVLETVKAMMVPQ